MSGFFYRLLIGMGQTTLGYREALLRCEPGWKLLDIGTGDGYALLRNAELIKENKWEIDCIEPDREAAKLLEVSLTEAGLDDQVNVRVEYLECATSAEYDACLCITTLICFPDTKSRRECINNCLSHVRHHGKVIIHQTLYGGLNDIFLLTRYLTSFTVYYLYRPLYINDLKELFTGHLWDMEMIHWLFPYMLFTVRHYPKEKLTNGHQ